MQLGFTPSSAGGPATSLCYIVSLQGLACAADRHACDVQPCKPADSSLRYLSPLLIVNKQPGCGIRPMPCQHPCQRMCALCHPAFCCTTCAHTCTTANLWAPLDYAAHSNYARYCNLKIQLLCAAVSTATSVHVLHQAAVLHGKLQLAMPIIIESLVSAAADNTPEHMDFHRCACYSQIQHCVAHPAFFQLIC